VDEGIEEIKRRIQKSRRIRVNNIPMKLLDDLKSLLKDRDLKIILPIGVEPTEDLKQLGEIATTKARIYVDFKGTEANTGSILFSTAIFNIVWLGNKIFDVSMMEYSRCIKCLIGTFNIGWRLSKKW
jgi:hypothetical protein